MNWMPWLRICKASVMPGAGVEMDINVIRGAILVLLIFSFSGLCVWAWSHKRKSAFHEASLMPLEDDNGVIPDDEAQLTERGTHHVK